MRQTWIVAATAIGLMLPGAAGAAMAKPDLRVDGFTNPTARAPAGSELILSTAMSNRGRRMAPASQMGFYLSLDGRRSASDIRLVPRAAMLALERDTRVRAKRKAARAPTPTATR